MKIIYRQGDVALVQVDRIPAGAKMESAKGPIILALGEVTGHHHAILDREHVRTFNFNGDQFLDVKGLSALLTHQEHASIEIPKGRYRKIQQRQYTPEGIRRVED